MALGFGKKSTSLSGGVFGGTPRGYYVPGSGYHNRETQTTQNDLGESVVQIGGALRNADGTLHAAYGAAPGTRIASLIAKQRAGFPLTEAELAELRAFWAKDPTNGLTNIGNYRGGGIITYQGTPDKYIQRANKDYMNLKKGK